MVNTPVCFPLKRPTLKCNVSTRGRPNITVTAPPQIAANNANVGFVDWQVVAWTMLVYRWDAGAQQWHLVSQTPWYWDQPYDLFDGDPKNFPQNSWRRFDPRGDHKVINVAGKIWPLPREGGYFTADFREYWYPASSTSPRRPVPSGAWTSRNFDATGPNAVTHNQSGTYLTEPYCRFPAGASGLPPLVVPGVDRYFAEVTGDAKADAISVSDRSVNVRVAAANVFERAKDWSDGPYRGSLGTDFADVTGDRKADAIAVNKDTVLVRPSIGTRFRPPQDWTQGRFNGTRGTYFADVTDDGRADAIAVNDNTVLVRPSTGTGFSPNQDWTQGPYHGARGTYFADVTGDGRADAIAVNDNTVLVRPSTGAGFSPSQDWTQGPYFGARGTYFADVTGDRKADAIAVNDNTVLVRPSTGTGFGPPQDWTQGPYSGARGTYFADVTGDGKADAVAVSSTGTLTVRVSIGSTFGPSQNWTPGA